MNDESPTSLPKTGTFRAFGLTVSSCIHCPELSPSVGIPDVIVSYGVVPSQVPEGRVERVWYQATPGQFVLEVDRVARFSVRQGRHIIIDRHPDAIDDNVRVFLLGSVFGALLHQRGSLVLHGSTIKVDNGCVVFLGKSGTGKSTLAAALRRKGYSSLGDDLCVVSIDDAGVPYAAPAYPQAKLWGDTLQRLGIDETGLRRVRPSRAKKAVPIEDAWHEGHVPVKRLYVLSPGWRKQHPVLQPISGSVKFRVLRDYTYRVEFLQGLDLTLQHFKQVAELASRLPITRVVRPADGFLLDEFVDTIEEDFGAHRAPADPPVHVET